MRKKVVTTVLTAAPTRNLIDLGTVRDDWGMYPSENDEFLERSISRCSAAVEQFCNRPFAIEQLKDEFSLSRESYPNMMVRDLEVLQLSRWPIASVVSVTEDGKALTKDVDFRVVDEPGQLIRLDTQGFVQPWKGDLVSVVYYSGYILPGMNAANYPVGSPTLPPDVEDAVSRMVYMRFAQRQRDPLVKSEVVEGIGRTDYLTPAGSAGNMTDDITDILDNYRVPLVR